MATKRSSSKTAAVAPPAVSQPARRSTDALEIATGQDTNSQKMEKLITTSATSSITLKTLRRCQRNRQQPRRLRLAGGLTQEQLGLESGVQRNFISLIETGQNQPTISTIFKLAQALGIKPSLLVEEAEREYGALPH